MAGANKAASIYVSLDTLLDIRLATLAALNEDAAKHALANGYHKRTSDNFENVDMAAYKEMYEKRDVTILQKAMVTNAIRLLTHITSELIEQAIVRPYHDAVEISVNTFPYKLSNEDNRELARVISVWIKHDVTVVVDYMPLESLTPEHCKRSYGLMMMYDYEYWLNMHSPKFDECVMTDIVLLAPAIYFGKVPTPEQLAEMTVGALTPMRSVELLAAAIIELKLLDIGTFSIISDKVPA